jgi:hypothetical protein
MKAKNVIVLISICLFGFLGCSYPKNLTSSTKGKSISEEKRSEFTTGEIHTFIDSTKKADLDIKYFKIEFYPLEEKSVVPSLEPEKSPVVANVNPANKKPPDKGAIKSIEGFILSSTSEEKGIAETNEKNTSQKGEEINAHNSLETDITEETAEDPLQVALHIGDTCSNNSNWGSRVFSSSEKQSSHIYKEVFLFIIT